MARQNHEMHDFAQSNPIHFTWSIGPPLIRPNFSDNAGFAKPNNQI